ncbi:hypothetical protein LZC00_09810, partial [Campylobacter coli]|uniref:hypothetical protein n=1 Tax=Campylobacter coli TaxID=195 RepID=UPI0023E19069
FGQDQLIGPLGEYLRRYPQTYVEWTLNDHSPDFIPEGVDCAIHVGAVTDPWSWRYCWRRCRAAR